MYTLESLEQRWEQTGCHGTPAQRISRTKEWLPYYSYLAKNMQKQTISAPIQTSPIVAHMVRENILTKDTSVLDIGAGMGNLTLELGANSLSVTALEPCGECIDLIKNRADQINLKNIYPVQGFWETYCPAKQYDVTFSSMCPAICNVEELERMESLTHRMCCLVAPVRGSYDKHRKTMMTQLGIVPRGGMTTEALFYINALYLMGRPVNTKCFEMHQISKIPIERVLEQYPIYFGIFGIPERESKAFLHSYLEKHAVDGFLIEESCLKQALIYWEVPN